MHLKLHLRGDVRLQCLCLPERDLSSSTLANSVSPPLRQCSQCEIFVANSAIYHFIDTSDMDQAGFTQWLDLISILGLTYQVRFSQPHLLQGNSQWCNDLVQIAEQGGFPLGSASIGQLVNKLIYVDDPRLQEALHLSVDEHFTAYQPSFPLTAFTTTSHSHDPFDSSDFARVAGCCRPDLLAYVFGIPQLRDRCMLAYCVHAKKMQDNLRATCTVGPGVTAVTIDPIFKAAAMEEMFLF